MPTHTRTATAGAGHDREPASEPAAAGVGVDPLKSVCQWSSLLLGSLMVRTSWELRELLAAGGTVVVNCQEGLHRSVAFSRQLLELAARDSRPARSALDAIAELPCRAQRRP